MSLGDWWYVHHKNDKPYGMNEWRNVEDNCEKQNGAQNCWDNPSVPGVDMRWGSAQLYSDIKQTNSQFTMDCEYGPQSASFSTSMRMPGVIPGDWTEYQIPDELIFLEKFKPNSVCWYLPDNDIRDSGSGLSLIIDKQYWQNLIKLKEWYHD